MGTTGHGTVCLDGRTVGTYALMEVLGMEVVSVFQCYDIAAAIKDVYSSQYSSNHISNEELVAHSSNSVITQGY